MRRPPGQERCSKSATGGWAPLRLRRRGCTSGRCVTARLSTSPTPAATILSGTRRVPLLSAADWSAAEPGSPPGVAHVLVRKNHALAHQDRAPYAVGPGRAVDQVSGLRRRAL